MLSSTALTPQSLPHALLPAKPPRWGLGQPRASTTTVWAARGKRGRQNGEQGGAKGRKPRWGGKGSEARPVRDPYARGWMDQECELPPWPAACPAPKLMVFDLDDTIWFPEMYMISGAPFTKDEAGQVTDQRGEVVRTYPAARAALRAITTDHNLADTRVAYASRTSHKDWAVTCMRLLTIGGADEQTLEEVCDFLEIYGGTKKTHFGALRRDSGVAYTDMLFFDNEQWNCQEVRQLGVPSVYCSRGMDAAAWEQGIREFSQSKKKVYPK